TKLQAAYDAAQEQLSNLQRQLSELQQKLAEFTNPKLKGMQEFDDKIFAINFQLRRIRMADEQKKPLSAIISQFPLASKAMEQFLKTLPKDPKKLQEILERLELEKG